MFVARSGILSVCVLLAVMMSVGSLVASSIVPIDATDLRVKLSTKEVQIGQRLIINATVVTTEPLYYRWGTVIISNLDTGYIVLTSSFNLTSKQNLTIVYPGAKYTLYGQYIYEPMRPILFGEYTVWVRVGNMSAFERVTIVPSIADFYTDLRDMERKYEESMNNYWYIIRIIYPAAFMLSGMTILICYYLWRLPDSNKEELKYWLLSKVDVKKLEAMQKELRDIDRRGFSARNAPAVGHNEKIISGLKAKKKVFEKLKSHTERRIQKMNRMTSNASEFLASLNETINVLDEEIATRNADVEKTMVSLQAEAQKLNRRRMIQKTPEREMPPMDMERLRRIKMKAMKESEK